MRFMPDAPLGGPSFELAEDEIETVIDLICRGAEAARAQLTSGMLEVPITIHVKKAMRRLKRDMRLTNLEIGGEFEVLDIENSDPEVQGRIDITVKFLQQFGNEDNYLGVECKRVAFGETDLNQRYVSQGVERFVSGQYGSGHQWGMMLGYALRLPIEAVIATIDNRICKAYGVGSKLTQTGFHPCALSIQEGAVKQSGAEKEMRIVHLFVDMQPAAKATKN